MPLRTCSTAVSALLIACSTALLVAPAPASAEDLLYSLDTTCSVAGGDPRPCTVEAVDEGTATLYRHRIGTTTETIRITDSPIRMTRQLRSGGQWPSLTSAAARFSTNTICFDGNELCVVNPNYLNSVVEENPEALADRDLVRVHFGSDGRIDITCYDDGCEVIKP